MDQIKILNYGSLNIDLIFTVDHIVLPGETISSSSLIKSAGGKGANQSAALGKAGTHVFHAGKVGEDGRFLIELLRDYGVDTRFISVGENPSGQALIQLDRNSQNSIILFPGENKTITTDEIDKVLQFFSFGDYLVVQNEIVHTAYLMENAHKKGMKICFNPAPFDASVCSLPLHLVDILVVNEIEGQGLAQMTKLPKDDDDYRSIVESLVSLYPHAEIILTAGKAGAYYGYEELRAKGDIVDLPVVDTTGAGDTFIGYFLASRLRGLSVSESLQKGCLASSLAVTKLGAMQSIPYAKEVSEA